MLRYLFIVAWLVVCIIAAGGLAGCSQAAPTPAAGPAADEPAKVNTDVVSAEAEVAPCQKTDLSFKASGRIKEILVSVSDSVQKGQVLARLESTDLELTVQQAQSRLQSAEAQLAKVKAGARPEEIAVAEAAVTIAKANGSVADTAVKVAEGNLASAQAAVASAQALLDRTKQGPTPEEANEAGTVMQQADAAVKQAQAAYDRVKGDPNAAVMPQALQLQQATNEYNRAKASYQNLLNGATPAEIRVFERQVAEAQVAVGTAEAQVEQARSQAEAAKAQVTQAQAQLALTKAPAPAEDIAIAEAAVAETKVGVDQATAALADAVLTAPFAGVIGAVPANAGQLVSPQVTVVRLGDLSKLQLETKDLSEADINQVQLGQDVSISLDALPGQKFAGKVARISPVATDNRGDQVYMVTISPDAGIDSGMRWGMTAFVDIKAR